MGQPTELRKSPSVPFTLPCYNSQVHSRAQPLDGSIFMWGMGCFISGLLGAYGVCAEQCGEHG